jgi:PTH1 family peptidyl-tRNA hydrolase
MLLIVGLGNPGTQYEGSRHNIGFEVADALAALCRSDFQPGKGDYLIATARYQAHRLAIVKPLTFMNNSGDAVRDALARLDVAPERCLVVCDDFQLPLGQLRLRTRGSDGGHNGLYSIIYQLETEDFPRLRCGIGSPHMPAEKSLMVSFVLSPFERDERDAVSAMIQRARDACLSVATEGLVPAMNTFNTRHLQP